MIVQVVYLEVQEGKLPDFLAETSANVLASLQEPGITRFDLLQLEQEPLKFMLYEVYRTPQDLEAHRLTPHYLRWRERGAPLLSGERVRKVYQLIEMDA